MINIHGSMLPCRVKPATQLTAQEREAEAKEVGVCWEVGMQTIPRFPHAPFPSLVTQSRLLQALCIKHVTVRTGKYRQVPARMQYNFALLRDEGEATGVLSEAYMPEQRMRQRHGAVTTRHR